MSQNTTDEMIAEYLKNGGKVTKLRYASEKDQKKASKKWNHRVKAINGNQSSKDFLMKEDEKQEMMIFSTIDQWRE